MTEYTSDSLLPRKHGKISPFAFLVWSLIALVAVAVVILTVTKFDIARLRGADHFISKARQAVVAKDWPAAVWALQRIPGHVRERDDYLRVLADFLKHPAVIPLC